MFLNGLILGAHASAVRLVASVRSLRRAGAVGEFVSIYLDRSQRAVHIASDGGRLCRPLILVDPANQRPRLTQRHLTELEQGARGWSDSRHSDWPS